MTVGVPFWVKFIAIVLAFGGLVFALPAAVATALLADGLTADRSTSQTVPVAPGATVNVEAAAVELTVEGGSPGLVQVEEHDTVRALTRRLAGTTLNQLRTTVEPSLDGLKVTTSTTSFKAFGGFERRQLTLRVPSDVNVVVDTASGDLRVSGLRGNLAITTESGSVRLDDVDVTGTASVHVVSGQIVYRGAIDGGQVDLSTISGSINVFLPASTNLHYQASTVSGNVSVSNRGPLSGFGHEPNRTASGNLGSGGPATLAMNAISGNISVHTG
ncbi:MAG TPA: DUF4097 family beta strand repeat-containing protein [Candidatus Dormibacteraeota bacterium]